LTGPRPIPSLLHRRVRGGYILQGSILFIPVSCHDGKKETSALSTWGILGVLLSNVNDLPDLRELLQDGESEFDGSWQRHSQWRDFRVLSSKIPRSQLFVPECLAGPSQSRSAFYQFDIGIPSPPPSRMSRVGHTRCRVDSSPSSRHSLPRHR
jgi:hypothetical protein